MTEVKDIVKGIINEDPIAVKEALGDILKQKIADKFKETKGEVE